MPETSNPQTKNKAIKFIRSFATERESFLEGREYTFPADEADQFIANGLANELAAAPPTVAPAEPVDQTRAPRPAKKSK